MGWSTDLFCSLNFNRKTYNSLYEVQEDIRSIKREIETCKKSINTLVYMTDPEKFYDKKEYNSPIEWVREEYESSMEVLEELLIDLYKLEILEDCWEQCHDKEGYAIPYPDNIHWNSAFLDGDFVNTTKDKDKNTLKL